VALMCHFFSLRQQIVSKRQNDHSLQVSLQKLCHVGVAFISNSDSPTEQSNISSNQTHASSKAPDVYDTALVMRGSYTSILQGLDKLWANSDSTSEVGSVVYEIIGLFEAILAKINTLVVRKAKETAKKSPSRKQRQPKQSLDHQKSLPHSYCTITMPHVSLIQLATRMLTTINPSHSHILEGCLCAFLDHLGSSLSLAVLTNPGLRRSSKPSTASYRPKICRKCRPWTQRLRCEQSS